MSIEGLKQRFHSLGAEREAILSRSAPANAVRDAVRERTAELETIDRALTAEIRRIEAPLFDIDVTRGAMVRALKGKTGEAPPSKANPMNTDDVAALIKSLKLGREIMVQVSGAAPVADDPRLASAMEAISALQEQIAALKTTPRVQPFDASTIYADMKSVAEAVHIHDAKIAQVTASVKQITSDLGAFVKRLEGHSV